jgi:hypothetical protein
MSTVTTSTRQALVNSTICLLMIAGGAMLFGAIAYRIFIRPDLAAAPAFDLLWPYFAGGTIAVALGWLLDRAEG